MKVNKINIIYSRTVQMRQFEPATISVSIEAQVDPNETAADVIHKTRITAREQVEMERQRLLTERRDSFNDDKEKAA